MKTNVVLQSADRELFGITIRQNTKGEFLSVTDLQKAYEIARGQYGWSERRVNDILSYEITQIRIYELLLERQIIKTPLNVFMEMVKKEGITSALKGLNLYKTTGRAENKQVMADPYIWVLLAMELNPKLWAKTIIWVTDTLIFDRIDAGNEFRPMNSAIKSVVKNPDYPLIAKTVNTRVFGQHQPGMRNLASAKELRKVADIEKFITNAISAGWLKSDEQIINAINNYK
jgi:hypothetical protein